MVEDLENCSYLDSDMALRYDGRVVVVTGAGRGTVFNSSSKSWFGDFKP